MKKTNEPLFPFKLYRCCTYRNKLLYCKKSTIAGFEARASRVERGLGRRETKQMLEGVAVRGWTTEIYREKNNEVEKFKKNSVRRRGNCGGRTLAVGDR